AIAAIGCSRRETAPSAEGKPGGSASEHADRHDVDHSSKSPDVVRIDQEMLRDLRITTAAVETRPGAESAPVPAEVRVPEDAYAEVSSPVAARATRVSVTA